MNAAPSELLTLFKVVVRNLNRFELDLPGILVSREPLPERCGKCGDNLSLLIYVDPATGALERIGACEHCRIIYETISR